MTGTRLQPFAPSAVLEGGRSEVASTVFPSRRSTTEEQRDEAIAHATAWMLEHYVWTVEVEVRWTRTEPTVLTVIGHAEHLAGRQVAAIDRVLEHDLAGRAIVTSAAERHAALERDLGEIYDEGL